jgi:hypothetical protein
MLLASALALAACGRAQPDPPPSRAWASSASASALLSSPSASARAPSSAAEAEAPATSASVDEALPSPSASTSASASSSAPIAIEFPSELPPPKLRVYAIGLHIGGGPNDDVTKEPIHASVAPHLESIKKCWPWLDAKERRHAGDFGVDLTIEAEGGRAKVQNPRGLKGDAFQRCLVQVFQSIEFRRPKTGKTLASYSVHFAP